MTVEFWCWMNHSRLGGRYAGDIFGQVHVHLLGVETGEGQHGEGGGGGGLYGVARSRYRSKRWLESKKLLNACGNPQGGGRQKNYGLEVEVCLVFFLFNPLLTPLPLM